MKKKAVQSLSKHGAKSAANLDPSFTGTCNLCGGRYKPKNKYSRFCQTCRYENEIYRMAEWLPDASWAS